MKYRATMESQVGSATPVVLKKKHINDWVIEGPTHIKRHSVISQGHYEGVKKPPEFLTELMGRDPRLMMDIHAISDVNTVELAELPGPATNATFNGNPAAVGHNVTDVKMGEGSNKEGTDSANPNTP